MLDRRQFLGDVAAAGAALVLVRAAGVDRDSTSDLRDLSHPELLTGLGAEWVREIGHGYRALVPAESDRTALETALRAARSSGSDSVRADFAAGRVVVVRDWVLSRTEARQCALFSLLPA